jgi:DNA polymerase elongation subunit (family B)
MVKCTESVSPYLDISHSIPYVSFAYSSIISADFLITEEAYKIANEMQAYLNEAITMWAEEDLHSDDSRLYFKRETICPSVIYESKKHYIMHIADKGEGDPEPCDEMKYVGVEVVKSTMSNEVKKLLKGIIESIMKVGNEIDAENIYRDAYAKYKELPIEDIAFRSNINNYETYELRSKGFQVAKRTPAHVKASIYYNKLLKLFKIDGIYNSIGSGNKIKWFYCESNQYGIENFAFATTYPDEFKGVIEVNHKKMFRKAVGEAVDRIYKCVSWSAVDIQNEVTTNILQLFKQD